MQVRSYLLVATLLAASFTFVVVKTRKTIATATERTIETIYGTFHESDQALLDLIDSDAMQRLKKVDQYGPMWSRSFSRYDHSVGVWVLLKKFGASREEQIAGLLHDASHTVFSHVGDKVFRCAEKEDAYQDNIHEWYLAQTDVPEILKKHNIPFSVVDHKASEYHLLEQDLPDICADRLEYNLRGGLVEGLITKQEVKEILSDIRYENGKYFFINTRSAKKFSEIPLYHTEHVWGSTDGFIAQVFLAHALRRAVDIGLITLHDIHFSTDDVVLKALQESKDEQIKEDLGRAFHSKSFYREGSSDDFDRFFVCKSRGIDPLVQCEHGVFKRLTELDRNFSQYYTLLTNRMNKGFYIKLTDETLLARNDYLDEVFAV